MKKGPKKGTGSGPGLQASINPRESNSQNEQKRGEREILWFGGKLCNEPEENDALLTDDSLAFSRQASPTFPSQATQQLHEDPYPFISTASSSSTPSPTKPHTIWTSIQFFPAQFWLLCCICILLYGTVVPFNTFMSDFLQSKWFPGDPVTAGLVMRFVNGVTPHQ